MTRLVGLYDVWLYLAIGLAALVLILTGVQLLLLKRKLRYRQLTCPRCGREGSLSYRAQGSLLIELLLWSSFFLPGLFYSFWRNARHEVLCRACGHRMAVKDAPSPDVPRRILARD